MNEGENSNFSNNPNFSNQNFPSNAASNLGATNDSMPHAITSSDIAATAGTEAGVVAAAAAAMPENDARQAISSAPASTGASSRSRFNFGSRRYNSNSTPTTQPSPIFAGAPDYFNQAAGDIVLEGDKKPKGRKKAVAIVAIIAVIIAAVAAAVLLVPGAKRNEMAGLKPAEASGLFRDAASDVAVLEEQYERAVKGHIDVYELLTEETCSEIDAGVKAYSILKAKIKEYIDINNDDISKQLVEIYGQMNSEDRYSGLGEKCIFAKKFISGEKRDDAAGRYGDKYASALKEVDNVKNASEAIEDENKKQTRKKMGSSSTSAECVENHKKMKKIEDDMRTTGETIARDILGVYPYEDNERVGVRILDVIRTMRSEGKNE